MKFIDPLITLQYMGGGIPTHIGMAIYSWSTVTQLHTEIAKFKPDCLGYDSDLPGYWDLTYISDVEFTSIVHPTCIVLIFLTYVFRGQCCWYKERLAACDYFR